MIKLSINGSEYQLDVAPDTPLLWAIRDHAKLTGTKFGCGSALCGACTVHLDGQPIRSCSTPVSIAEGKNVTTIEGIGETKEGQVIQEVWDDVVQCGYCQSGQIMSAAALLKGNPNPSDTDIDNAMTGNVCRCNTYHRVRKGIHAAAKKLS
ncbi:(2Fe-2S)-binding protein [Candidatus Albibeggiatoa sp. nov. NOAA]|uniref:(2Fe-2S)-binding protein n=1 Tax=Candidatus Albibeggiatoa sp. nov. NOAA TaxID=3162724 RepID=UPI0032FC6596|nr:(2Fe-2S)-binding protein [Thiotrichaceae bacterium]